MPITINVVGLNELNSGLIKLPENLRKFASNITNETSKYIERSSKIRAPIWRGHLQGGIFAQWITKEADKFEMQVIVQGSAANYALYQERGFMAHAVKGSTPTRTGELFMDWAQEKGFTDFGPDSFMIVKKWYRPEGYIIGPSVTNANDVLPAMIQRGMDDAIRNSIS
jgi:hypothetical protein